MQVGDIREQSDDNVTKYQRDIAIFQKQIQEMRQELTSKEGHIRNLIADKDLLHQQLDDKTIRNEDLKKKLSEIEANCVKTEVIPKANFTRLPIGTDGSSLGS